MRNAECGLGFGDLGVGDRRQQGSATRAVLPQPGPTSSVLLGTTSDRTIHLPLSPLVELESEQIALCPKYTELLSVKMVLLDELIKIWCVWPPHCAGQRGAVHGSWPRYFSLAATS